MKKYSENNDKNVQEGALRKREYRDEEGNEISRKRSKKLKRIARRPNRATSIPKRSSDRCYACPNPLVSWNTFKIFSSCSLSIDITKYFEEKVLISYFKL